MNDLREAAIDLMTTVQFAIKSGDWKVDGACDPTLDIERLRQALAHPDLAKVGEVGVWGNETAKGEHEPFIYIREDTEMPFGGYEHCGQHDPGAFPVYTAPPQKEWVGLSDEELKQSYCEVSAKEWCLGGLSNAHTFYKAIEAKLKEKNT